MPRPQVVSYFLSLKGEGVPLADPWALPQWLVQLQKCPYLCWNQWVEPPVKKKLGAALGMVRKWLRKLNIVF